MPEAEPSPSRPKFHPYPFWTPRFWHGMRTGDWLRLVARNRFRIHPLRIPLAAAVTGFSLFNSGAGLLQRLLYQRKINSVTLEKPPLFIVGHWRSGTTYLHELMVRDPQFAFPTTYECFAPTHFLVTGWFLPWLASPLMPSKRPMDNMSAGFDHPQEDEFALANMGCPTPYSRMAFPNHPPCHQNLLEMEGVEPRILERWKRDLRWFVNALTLKKQKQLVLKSPPHTGRVGVLSQMFPGARFIHIARHPDAIFASTRRLWQSLDSVQGLQLPQHRDLDELVFDSFERMYRGYWKADQLDESQRYEIRYEDLVRDPAGRLEEIYQKLDLGDFETVRPHLQEYLQKQRDYKTNRHQLEPEIQQEIRRRWKEYFERYDYE